MMDGSPSPNSLPRFVIAAITLLLALPAVVAAQMPTPVLSLGGREWSPENTCANAPGPCEGETWDVTLGMHEFVLSRVPWFDPTEIVEVTLHWPAAWSFLGWELCTGMLVSGDPSVQGSTLRFVFEDCPDEGRFLRLWMDCPVPGSFQAAPGLLTTCWGTGAEELMGLYVDIGDWCGAAPHGHCDLCRYSGAAGYFNPGSVDVVVEEGQIWQDTLLVSGDTGPYCPGLPECCPTWGAGFGGLSGDPAWIEPTILGYEPDQGWDQMPYRLVIRGDLLGPGEYAGRVWANAGCCTHANCIPVTVTVLGASAVQEIRDFTGILGAPHPNPTAGPICFAVRLAEPGRVRVSVVDAAGRRVATVLDREFSAGTSIQQWRPSEGFRARLASGVYYLTLESAAGREVQDFVIRH